MVLTFAFGVVEDGFLGLDSELRMMETSPPPVNPSEGGAPALGTRVLEARGRDDVLGGGVLRIGSRFPGGASVDGFVDGPVEEGVGLVLSKVKDGRGVEDEVEFEVELELDLEVEEDVVVEVVVFVGVA